MRRALILVAALSAFALSGCEEPPDSRDVLMTRCYDLGGTYFEYEATSAGAHVWCVAPDGAEIRMDGGE